MSVIAVIPARRGSKAVPHKNIRMLHGKPLIAYSIENALLNRGIDEIIVTTDSPEVKKIALKYGVTVHKRPPELAEDAVPLDPVIVDAVRDRCKPGDIVITLQPTSPCLRSSTLATAIKQFQISKCDTMIAAVADPHLAWGVKNNGSVYPMYKQRVNRQLLPPEYRETGAFVMSRVGQDGFTRISGSVMLFIVPDEEGIDIDSWRDLLTAYAELECRKRFPLYSEKFPVYEK